MPRTYSCLCAHGSVQAMLGGSDVVSGLKQGQLCGCQTLYSSTLSSSLIVCLFLMHKVFQEDYWTESKGTSACIVVSSPHQESSLTARASPEYHCSRCGHKTEQTNKNSQWESFFLLLCSGCCLHPSLNTEPELVLEDQIFSSHTV